MKWSIRLWIFCLIAGRIVERLPIISEHWYLLVAGHLLAALLGKLLFFRRCSRAFRFEGSPTIIVTGANGGIGAETSKELIRRGGKVIFACRDTNKGWKYLNDIRWGSDFGPRGYVLQLDLASKKSIEDFVVEFKKREKTLNVLVMNAAYHGPRRKTVDGFEQTIGVNHLGHMYLTYLLRDYLKASGTEQNPARVVVVGSDLHRWSKRVHFEDLNFEKDYGVWKAYNHSKLCNVLFTRRLSQLWKNENVVVHTAHPGTPVQSDLMRNTWMGSTIFNNFIMPPIYLFYCRLAYEGAQTPTYVAVSPECATFTGGYYENVKRDEESAVGKDNRIAEQLWEVSNDLLKLDAFTW